MAIITKDVAESFRKNAKVFQAIIDAADVLDQLSSLDNATAESQARLTASKESEASVLAGIETLKAEIKSLTSKKSDAQLRADGLIMEAELQASSIVANGKIAAQSIVDNANRGAAAMAEESNARSLAILAAIAEKQAELDSITAELAEKSKERTTLQKAIDSLKAKFA